MNSHVLMDHMSVFVLSNMVLLSHYSCDFSDTAEYRISALNVKGESSAFASVIIKSRCTHLPENQFYCSCPRKQR